MSYDPASPDPEQSGSVKSGEVLEEDTPAPPPPEGSNWLALISNYTERPDLLIDAMERHDPGFTKRMNKAADERAEQNETARFKFGRFQAYAALTLSILAAFAIIFIVGYAVIAGSAGFLTIISLAVFYAITQGGSFGFEKIIHALSEMIKSFKGQ